MKTLVGFIAIAFSGCLTQAAENLRIFDDAKKAYVTVDLITHDGVTVSSSCKKDKRFKCEAIKPKLVKNPKLSKVPLLGNPASTYCAKVGGVSRILLDSKNAEYDFCLFKDGSMADSWQLFNKRAQK